MTPQAIPKRALFRQPTGPDSPLAAGRRFSSGTNTSSRAIAPVTGVDTFDLSGDQAIGYMTDTGATVFLRDRRAEQTQLAHFAHDLAMEALVAIGVNDARQQTPLAVAMSSVEDQTLALAELVV